jgi:hypothetical protein
VGELPPLVVRRRKPQGGGQQGEGHGAHGAESDSESSCSSTSSSSSGSEWDAQSTEYAGSFASSWHSQAHGTRHTRLIQARQARMMPQQEVQQQAAYVFLDNMIYKQTSPQEMEFTEMQALLFSALRRHRKNDFYYDLSLASARSGRSDGCSSIASFSREGGGGGKRGGD